MTATDCYLLGVILVMLTYFTMCCIDYYNGDEIELATNEIIVTIVFFALSWVGFGIFVIMSITTVCKKIDWSKPIVIIKRKKK